MVERKNRRAFIQEEVVEGMNAQMRLHLNCPKPRVRDSKYFMEQMLLAKQDEAGVILSDEQNDFLFADASRMEEIEELRNVNSGSVEKDTHVHDLCALETLARNAYAEAAKQQRFAQKVQQQNMTLTSQIKMYKERNRVLENITKDNNYLKEFLEADERAKRVQKQVDSQLKMSENEDKYHDTVLDLEEKLKKNVDMFLKIARSAHVSKFVNTMFDKTHGSQSFLCVTPLNKNVFQKQTVVLKTKENHVESKPVTLQTSHTKQTGTHQNTNVISPGMYRVVTQQESQTKKSKNVLSSIGMNVTSSVKRPKSRDSHVKTSILDVSKNEAKKEAV
ncbi:hypothetical protein Tco_1100948 [Tanacetum coccineum]